jgi:NAD(P)H-hydrate epimerase
LLLVGGGPGMPGAIHLAAEAALRVGAGLVVVATHADSAAAVLAGRPEIICHSVASGAELQ